MVAVPISHPGQGPSRRALQSGSERPNDWTHYFTAGTLVAGGLLIATGHRKAGLAVAATGAALAILDEREVVETMWKSLPAYLNEAQTMLNKVEGYLNEAVSQGHKLQNIIRR